MQHAKGCIGIGLLISSLCGCLIQEESGLKTATPTNEVSSVTDSGISDDGIIAPTAPTLTISAIAGALNFKWVDWRTNAKTTNSINLYEYNSLSEQEIELDTNIGASDLKYTLPITPHHLAWDSLSYRVEICNIDDCVSSSHVPVHTLLANVVTAVIPSNDDMRPSFGDDIAINAYGNVAVASSPVTASAAVLLHNEQHWIQASTLVSDHFANATNSDMRVSISASGDTVAIASATSNASPIIVIFDRLGENWIETARITTYEPLAISQRWDTASPSLQLSNNGDRIIFAAQPVVQSVNKLDIRSNQVLVFDRSAFNWTRSANLTIPIQHTRLRSTSASADISRVLALSTLSDSVYLHEFSLLSGQWHETSSQILDTVQPSLDTQIVSSDDSSLISLAAWEIDSDSRRSAVAWKFEKRAMGWITTDSIRLPPTADQSARLRLASDAQLESLAIGWQADNDANLAFYARYEQRWQHQFSVPEGLNLNRSLPLVQSIAVSADNSTALIGTTNTGSGGMLSSFR